MYCLCYYANGEASSGCASCGCVNTRHQLTFYLTVFMLFCGFFSSLRNVSIGKVQFCERCLHFTFQSYQSIVLFFAGLARTF